MKTLKSIFEGILDKDNKVKVGASMDASTKELVKQFVEENFWAIDMRISDTQVNGKWIVYATDVSLENPKLKSLTNGMFIWGDDMVSFNCNESDIETLEGAPKQCGIFSCGSCNIKSLEGGPEKVGHYYCEDCKKLVSLKGCPKDVYDFDCSGCDNLKSLKHLPKHGGTFYYRGKKSFDIEKEMKYINGWDEINF